MHLITLAAPLNLGNSYGTAGAGIWLMEDRNAFESALMSKPGDAHLQNVGTQLAPTEGKRNILIMRAGAIGDLLMLTPAIAALKRIHPDVAIHLSCFPSRAVIFEGTELVDKIEPYPFPADRVHEFEQVISLENVVELSKKHMTDAFADALGVVVEDYTPIYLVSDAEASTATLRVQHERPRVGIQMRASTANRDYPAALWAEVFTGLVARGWDVYFFGKKGQLPELPKEMRSKWIHDLSAEDPDLRSSVAMLSLMNAFVGVDSSLIHFCHALNVPAVGLYGAFDWKTRCAKAPLTLALQGDGDCKHCSWHAHAGHHFPPHMPCAKTKRCSVIETITPDRIIAKVDALKP